MDERSFSKGRLKRFKICVALKCVYLYRKSVISWTGPPFKTTIYTNFECKIFIMIIISSIEGALP